MTKDKYRYIENLFRNYKKNKSRIKILQLGYITDDDFTISAVDYSKDKIQTSNIINILLNASVSILLYLSYTLWVTIKLLSVSFLKFSALISKKSL